MTNITIVIDGKRYTAKPGESVLQVAIRNGIDIPHFCYHEDLPIDADCRTCLVQIEGIEKVTTSCTLAAQRGLSVSTKKRKVQKLRRENLELLMADHKKNCPRCKSGFFCMTAKKMKAAGVTGTKYIREKVHKPIHKLGTAAEFDPEMCINCNKCVEMCERIGIGFLKLEGKGSKRRLTYNKDPKVDCIYCGQCTVHCPVAAVREQNQIDAVEKALKDKTKIVIVQTAPSVRASIGEAFGYPPGTDLTGQLFSAYRKLGFDRVFDVNMGADITTMVEAEELVKRLKTGKGLPMFTSCCPGWVKFAEFYYPGILSHLTTARSPQMHSGGAYKTWWAEKEGIDPRDIVVVSMMPCTSKKYEAHNRKFDINGIPPVDHVLTTRELALLLRKRRIDIRKLKPGSVDPEGFYSGAAAIYGASGGVMESALRTAHHLLTGKELKHVEFKQVRGMKKIKEAVIQIGSKRLKVAVAATAHSARYIIEKIKKDPKAYDYVEVMACPGGCIGGGGQPIPSTEKIIAQRVASLYRIDKKMKIRKAHENPIVQDFFRYLEGKTEKEQGAILHTSYKRKRKFE